MIGDLPLLHLDASTTTTALHHSYGIDHHSNSEERSEKQMHDKSRNYW